MAEYNSVMNNRLYEVCGTLSDEVRKKDIRLFFKSIHKTLDHLLYGDMAWLLRFIDKEGDVPDIGQELYAQFDDLTKARKAWDQKLIVWSNSISDDWLEGDFLYTSKVDGKIRTKPTWLLVTHMFNHGTHHRGQLTTSLNQLGIDFGVTDLPFFINE